MIDLPSWLKIAVPELNCPHCDQPMQVEGVISIGVRYSSRDTEKTVLFFEYECTDCQSRAVVELNPMSLRQFVDCMFDNTYTKQSPAKKPFTNKDKIPKKNRDNKTKITQSEVKKTLKWLEECDNHNDFLLGIGLSQDEINIYKIEKKKNE